MKRKESRNAIKCNPLNGPCFGNGYIKISYNCNKNNSCSIYKDEDEEYELHPEYEYALFVNTAGPEEQNYFTVFDYEVYGIENYKDYIINLCTYPDIIREYIETNHISEESLRQVEDRAELLKDLDAIHCDDSNLRMKILKYLKNPSEFLPNTEIVNQQYDDKLREWLGNDYKWKLLYRASEHGYSAESFHEYCDDKGPTLIIIKSSGGWIFGGYTTQSWRPNSYCIYNDIIY